MSWPRSSSWVRSHQVMSSRTTPARSLPKSPTPLVDGHGERRGEGLGGPHHVGRCDGQRAVRHLVERAGRLGQDEHSVTLGNDHRLLGDEVHAVDQRIHEDRIGDREPGQRLGVVVLVEDLDRAP